ncbi:response regulator [Chryseobacterium sp. JJR-5R]|uniref:response regulator n=1 Tax=Chryseobacterium sp. JJR-5R TaxID=3093923 RepID=UPI002A75A702|nr:response regulator [Chryseobacterium sp. JJR-5R]WPO83513.1 response regulator [Chryseobacterium sp. JJR-5R]
MTRECLNVMLMDHDEGNHIFFKNIFQDLKIRIKTSVFFTGPDMVNYLKSEKAVIPELLFMNYDIPEKNVLNCLAEIRSCSKLSQMTVAVYSSDLSSDAEEEIFIKGANVMMTKPDNYKDLKKALTEIVTVNWQYHTSGLNKDNFIMKV